MGQYWIPVNLNKREYIDPHKLGCGLKLWEQVANHPSTGTALLILTAAMPEVRGGGDLELPDGEYGEIAKRTIGRWAGDRIALIGDYAERSDLHLKSTASNYVDADLIYFLCRTEDEKDAQVAHLRKLSKGQGNHKQKEDYLIKANRLENKKVFTDISDDVAAVIEHELGGKYTGDGWRDWKENQSR